MKKATVKQLMLGLAVSAMVAGSIPLANAQTASDATATAAPATTASSAKAAKAQHRAERKAARKQARAKKNAELKKLEDAGYQPGADDPNYPNNLQKAQKKAAAASGASQ